MTSATIELSETEIAVILRMRAASHVAALDAGQVAMGEASSENILPFNRDHA